MLQMGHLFIHCISFCLDLFCSILDGDSQLTKGVHGGELFNGRTTDDLRTNAAATKVNALSQRSGMFFIGAFISRKRKC